MSTSSISQARWRARFRRFKSQRANLIVGAIVIGVLTVAIYHGISDGALTWALPILILVLIPTIGFHEAAHALVAYLCGDDTAKRQGRISLNPRRHIDPVGTLIVPISIILLGGPPFGWAKPTPVALNRLRHPRNQAILVALAGPFANGIIAVGAAVGLHFIMAANLGQAPYIAYSVVTQSIVGSFNVIGWLGIIVGFVGIINLFIGLFNLVPIPPLDGASLLERFIPVSALETYYRIRTGFIVVIFILVWLDRSLMTRVYFDVANWYMNLLVPGAIK